MSRPLANPVVISGEALDAWFGLFRAQGVMRARIEPTLLREHQLTFSEFEVLCRCKDIEPIAVRALATELVTVSASRASRIVQRLVDDGFMQRAARQNDGRVSILSLTETGRARVAAASLTFEREVEKAFVDRLNDQDLTDLRRIWRKLDVSD